jgi:hypothetical protein
MNKEEYQNFWVESENSINRFADEKLHGYNLGPSTVKFLNDIGLPSYAAPFLSFVNDSEDHYEGICRLTSQYDFLEEEYSGYIVVGSDGSGNPIVINTEENDQIEWLDHEDCFSSRFLNTTIQEFASCLLIYNKFVNLVIKENGEDAIFNSNFTDEQYDWLKVEMIKIDINAVLQEGFWNEELELLLINRADYLKEMKYK